MTTNLQTTTTKQLNRENLKLLLMFLMVLDHLYFFISPYLADTFHLLTRVVAVGFGYLLVEGMQYTRSRPRYILRLFSWALLMGLGNHLLNTIYLSQNYHLGLIGDNILLTLALGAVVVSLWDNHQTTVKKQRRFKGLAIFLVILSLTAFVEGSLVVIPFVFITTLTYNDPKKRNRAYLIFALLLALVEVPMALSTGVMAPILIFDSIAMNASDPFFVLIIFILHFYNGRLGPYSTKLKYIFYIFYPLHLWLIHLIANYWAV